MGKPGGAPERKAAGTAINIKNGQRAVLTVVGSRFDLPVRADNTPWREEAVDAWESYWADTVSSVTTTTDRSLLTRWIDAVHCYWRAMEMAAKEPTVYTLNNGMSSNPMFKVAIALGCQIERMEAQLGIGPKNRASLGIQIVSLETQKTHPNNRPQSSTKSDYQEKDPRLL